jgi:U3 small nucleolar RNA-associated protein 23
MESKEATKAARGFERRKCNHWQTKETDGECIAGIIGNDNRYRYCVATQSVALRGALRRVPGVPILFEKRGMVLLEPPSDASVGTRKKVSLMILR